MSAAEEAIRMWEVFREGTIGELANIPEERWDYRPGEGARTLRELALHIAVSGIGFTSELLARETSFLRLRDPYVQAEMMARYSSVQSKQDIIDLLKTSMAEGAKSLRDAADTLSRQTMSMRSAEQSRTAASGSPALTRCITEVSSPRMRAASAWFRR